MSHRQQWVQGSCKQAQTSAQSQAMKPSSLSGFDACPAQILCALRSLQVQLRPASPCLSKPDKASTPVAWFCNGLQYPRQPRGVLPCFPRHCNQCQSLSPLLACLQAPTKLPAQPGSLTPRCWASPLQSQQPAMRHRKASKPRITMLPTLFPNWTQLMLEGKLILGSDGPCFAD